VRKAFPFFAFCFFLIFLLAACNRPSSQVSAPAPELPTMVAATLSALTPPPTFTPEPTYTPVPPATPSSATVSGKVCYPDKGIIRLTIYFQSAVAAAQVQTVTLDRPTETYSLELAPGTYSVFAWPPDYTRGVLPSSGMNVILPPGGNLTGIDLCDFSGGASAVPYPAGFTPATGPGSISGRVIGYTGPAATQMAVVAFNQGTGYWYYVLLMPGVSDFTISDLPAGRYQVVAYDGLGAAGGSEDVYVLAGQPASADIRNWGGTYPANPVK